MIRYFCDLCGKEQHKLYILTLCKYSILLRKEINICSECVDKIEKYMNRIAKHEDK